MIDKHILANLVERDLRVEPLERAGDCSPVGTPIRNFMS
jgi:hypothetical protein